MTDPTRGARPAAPRPGGDGGAVARPGSTLPTLGPVTGRRSSAARLTPQLVSAPGSHPRTVGQSQIARKAGEPRPPLSAGQSQHAARRPGGAVRPKNPRPPPQHPPIAARGAARHAELVRQRTAFGRPEEAAHPEMPRGGRCGSGKTISTEKKKLGYRLPILSRRDSTTVQKSGSQDRRGSCFPL